MPFWATRNGTSRTDTENGWKPSPNGWTTVSLIPSWACSSPGPRDTLSTVIGLYAVYVAQKHKLPSGHHRPHVSTWALTASSAPFASSREISSTSFPRALREI